MGATTSCSGFEGEGRCKNCKNRASPCPGSLGGSSPTRSSALNASAEEECDVPPDLEDVAEVSQQVEDSPITGGQQSLQKAVSLNLEKDEHIITNSEVEGNAPKELPESLPRAVEADSEGSVSTASWATSGSVKVSEKVSDGSGGGVTTTASGSSKPKKKAKAKPKAKSKASESANPSEPPKNAILVFETKQGKVTRNLANRPPGFSVRFPAMDVIRVTAPPATDMGIQVGWKLVSWGSNKDDMFSKEREKDTGLLRESFVNLIKQLPRMEGPAKAGENAAQMLATTAAGDDDEGEEVQQGTKPGRWVYELDVTIIGAKKLRDADWAPGGGSSDPYCVCSVQGKGKASFKTKHINNNREPVWNHSAKINDMHDGDQLFFEILDHDVVGKHDSLGCASIGWEELQEDGPFNFALELTGNGKKKAAKDSVLNVKVTVAKRKIEMGASMGSKEDLYRLYVNIISARGLREADRFIGGGSSDPYCVVSVVGTGKSKYKTRTINDKTDPEWNETCVLPDFHNQDKLLFEVYDKDMGTKDDFLGKVEVPFDKVVHRGGGDGDVAGREMDLKLLDAGMVGKQKVDAFLKISYTAHKRDLQGLAPFHNQRKVAKGAMKYTLEVSLLSADGLRSADWMSAASDPYCICTVKGKGKSSIKTKVVHKELNPLWNHTEKIDDFYHGDALMIVVKDSDKLKHDDTLGSIQLQTAQVIPLGFEGDLKLRNTGFKEPEKNPVFVSVRIKVLERQPVSAPTK